MLSSDKVSLRVMETFLQSARFKFFSQFDILESKYNSSYAAGDPMPIPAWIYITAAGMLALSLAAYFRNKGSKKQKSI